MKLSEIIKTKKLYHISFDGDLEGEWKPKLPDGYDDKPSKNKEFDIPRICVSPSINQCFQAIYPNVSKYFEELHYPNMDFFVYSPILNGEQRILSPEYLTKKKMVHDAFLTDEHDILDTVYMKRIGKVQILNTEKNEFIKYHPFNNPENEEQDFAPDNIIWKWI